MLQKPEENVTSQTQPQQQRTDSKFFKFLTLGVYLAGVSGLGFCISVYLIFIWDSKMPPIPDVHHHHTPGYSG